jgi:hypothetical protein
LHAKNKITVPAALDAPFLRYHLGVINWRLEEITKRNENYKCTYNVQNASPKN